MKKDRKVRAAVPYILRAVLVIACFLKWKMDIRTVIAGVFLMILSYVAELDIYTQKIPDRLVLSVGAAGIVSVPFFPGISPGNRMAGFLCVSCLLLAVALIAPGSFGGGDIKLMAASGIFLGWKGNLRAFAAGVFLAGAYCVWMLLRGWLDGKARIPFGPFLCAGIAVEVFYFMH